MSTSRSDKGKQIANEPRRVRPRRKQSGGGVHISDDYESSPPLLRRNLEDIEEEIMGDDYTEEDETITRESYDREYAERLQRHEAELADAAMRPSHRPSRPSPTVNLEDSYEEEDDGDTPNPSRSQRVLSSELFTIHFKKIEMPSKVLGEKTFMAFCNYCTKKYPWKPGNGYGTYRRHYESKHKADVEKGKRRQTQLNFQPGRREGEGGNPGLSESQIYSFNKLVAREQAARLIATESLPFGFTDSQNWEDRMRLGFQPAARRIPRTTMTRQIESLVRTYRLSLRSMFNNMENRVSINSDCWSDYKCKNYYIGVTVHWVDSSWSLNKRLIAFRKFNCSHNAQNIAGILIKILTFFKLIDKIFTMGFDNASANTASIPSLVQACKPALGGKLFHVRCICHVLNLCVQDGMTVFEYSIDPIRKAVAYLNARPKASRMWCKFLKRQGIKDKIFSNDVDTRWNSTYHMLASTYKFKDLLCEFFTNELTNCDLILLSSYWDDCSDLMELLQVFETATKDLSGVYYPTSCKVIFHCCFIAAALNKCSKSSKLVDVVYGMVLKWLKYFTHIHDVFLFSACLNPAFNVDGVCELLDCYYATFKDMPFAGPDGIHLELPNVDCAKNNLKFNLESLFKEYVAKYSAQVQQQTTRFSKSTFNLESSSNNPCVQRLQNFLTNRGGGGRGATTDLEKYYLEKWVPESNDVGPNDMDVLKWWSKRQDTYPILHHMAKELFGVPASTVSVEQAFSEGGYMLDARRSRLSAAHLEAQMLLKDATRAEDRAQENRWDELMDDTEGPTATESGTGTDTSQATTQGETDQELDDYYDDDFDL